MQISLSGHYNNLNSTGTTRRPYPFPVLNFSWLTLNTGNLELKIFLRLFMFLGIGIKWNFKMSPDFGSSYENKIKPCYEM